jgi:hypothetical protein
VLCLGQVRVRRGGVFVRPLYGIYLKGDQKLFPWKYRRAVAGGDRVCEGGKKGSRRVEMSGVIWESKRDKLGSWTRLARLSMRQSGDDQQWRVFGRRLWRTCEAEQSTIVQSSSVSF